MTIIIGAIHKDKIYIGTDSLWLFDDDLIREIPESKFLALQQSELLIAAAGDDRYSLIMEELLLKSPQNIETKRDLFTLANEFRAFLPKWGLPEEQTEHDFDFIVARRGIPKLWQIDSSFCVTEFDTWVCAGSGASLGEAAMKALSLKGILGKEAIGVSLETVGSLHPYCGGKVHIRELDSVVQ